MQLFCLDKYLRRRVFTPFITVVTSYYGIKRLVWRTAVVGGFGDNDDVTSDRRGIF